LAKQSLVTLDLDDMTPLHGPAACTISRLRAHGVAFTLRPTVTGIQDILPVRPLCSLRTRTRTQQTHQTHNQKQLHRFHILPSFAKERKMNSRRSIG
jgi:hypothetical protein